MLASTSSAPVAAPASRSAELWRAIEDNVREACLLRAEDRETEAILILQETLPPLIGDWSRNAGLEVPAAQQALREMFARVQQQVANAALCRRLVLRSLGQPAAPVPGPAPAPTFQLRRRVPIGDVTGMLDALGETERAQSAGRRALAAA